MAVQGLVDDSIAYTAGGFRVTARRPVLVHQTASSSAFAWFGNLVQCPTGELLARLNTWPDTVDAVNPVGMARLSYDGGRSWGRGYTPPGLPSAAEPLSAVGNDLVGCEYSPFAPFGDLRTFRATKVTISGGGLTHTTVANGITISGLPRDVRQWSGFSQYMVMWFSDIVKIAADNWVSILQVGYVGDEFLTPECIKSVDGGLTWARLAQACPSPGQFNDGFSETSLIRLLNGNLMCISRVGYGQRLGRTYSTDNGATWSSPDRLSPGTKAPRIIRLTNNPDYVIVAGQALQPTPERWASVGLYVSTDPTAVEWTAFDLCVHHNAMMPAAYHYDLRPYVPNFYFGPAATGYCGVVERSPGHVVILYDDGAGAYGYTPGALNRVYAVEVFITRA